MRESHPEIPGWSPDLGKIEAAYESILDEIYPKQWRIDPNTKETPKRAAAGMVDLLDGYADHPTNHIKQFADNSYDQIIAVRKIPYYSLCAHHLLPFHGTVSIAYIPERNVLGLSKFARIVKCYAKRLQIQERMTNQIAFAIQDGLTCRGVMVIVEGEHLCMSMRGVECHGAKTVTSAVTGVFAEDASAKSEALALLKEG